MAADAGVAVLAAERASSVVASAATLEAGSEMLFESRKRYLNSRCAARKHAMTFRAIDSFTLRVDLMIESEPVSSAHHRRRRLVARSRVTFAAACSTYSLARFHLLRRFMTDVTFLVSGKSGSRARNRVTVRALGSPLAALISRVCLVRELCPEALPFREGQHFGLHRRYSFVAVCADAETGRSKLFDVTRDAGAMAGHHWLYGVGPPRVALVAFDIAVLC